jgi:hypothetical protein
MSLQVAILKVLSGHPGGCASVSDLNSDLAFLISIGAEWTNQMRRLAARAPGLDIFCQGLVTRDAVGWHLTPAGCDFLTSIEAPDRALPSIEGGMTEVRAADQPSPVANVINLNDHRRGPRRQHRQAC